MGELFTEGDDGVKDFANPVLTWKIVGKGNVGEEEFTTRAHVREKNGFARKGDGEEEFANPIKKELLKNFNI